MVTKNLNIDELAEILINISLSTETMKKNEAHYNELKRITREALLDIIKRLSAVMQNYE